MAATAIYDGSMSYFDVLGVPHAYRLTPETQQSETTVVFVHGWLLSQGYWQPVIDRLNPDFQCLSYDLRGFGESSQGLAGRSPVTATHLSNDPTPFSLEAYAQDLGALLAALDLNSVWLVGHSLGGSVALWAAKLFPQRVQGVVCVNAGGGMYLPDEFARFRQAGQQVVRWRPPWLKAVPLINRAFASMMVHKPLALHWGEQRLTDLLAADAAAAQGVLLESTTEAEVHRLPQVVASLEQPAYFVAGAQDPVMETKYVQHLASFHPLFDSSEGNVAVLPECGHMAMVEQPEALANIIRQHLSTAVGPSQNACAKDSVMQ